jgi:alanyl-tRNA synthetase
MQPLIPYLSGERHPLGKRLANVQLCFRGQGINSDDTWQVGNTRHTTFFEMEGNWSLGDYFRKEQLTYFFTFLTDEQDGLGLAPARLYVTVFAGNQNVPKDTESVEVWQKLFAEKGIRAREGERIWAYGEEKNWWSRSGTVEQMPPGEIGGPDSEVFYDFGRPHDQEFGQVCHPNCECGRFLEIGNSVFMQYQKQADGSLKELVQKNVDFGGGLVRQLAAERNDPDIFKTDLYWGIIQAIEKAVGKNYGDEKSRGPMRIIADHLTAASFLVKAGVLPANKGQGYVLRRLIRRALVKMQGLRGEIVEQAARAIVEEVIKTYNGLYFDQKKDGQIINDEIGQEVSRFKKVLAKGLRVLEKAGSIDGHKAFDFYQNYGFPWELTVELAEEKGQKIERSEFEKEFKRHQDRSRTTSVGMFRGGLQGQGKIYRQYHTATHLLQAALRAILGKKAKQEGSNITTSRARFDFTYSVRLTEEEIDQVEGWLNRKIKENWPVTYEVQDKVEAIKRGALAFFPEKYPDRVRVYRIGDFSLEICAGPHVDFTGEIGPIKIIKQEAIGAGKRRLYLQLATAQDGSKKFS